MVMEGDNIMKRLTSFLVPSFVSNALTPRRGGPNSTDTVSDRNQTTTSGFNEVSSQASGTGISAPRASAAAPTQPLPPASTSASGVSAGSERFQRLRNRGLGGTGGSLWTSMIDGDFGGSAAGSGKRRYFDDDPSLAGASDNKRPRTLLSPTSSHSHSAAQGLSASLFYPGRTAYGGVFNAAASASRSVRATPLHASNCTSATDAPDASLHVLQQQPQIVTPTAKKILDTLDRLSTPLIDARRMPSNAASAASAVAAPPPFRVAYRRRMLAGQAPPTRAQQSGAAALNTSVAHDTYRSRGLLASVPQSQPTSQLPLASEFQFSAPIFRGKRSAIQESSSLTTLPAASSAQPSAATGATWQCLTCFVTNAASATTCASCSAAVKATSLTATAGPATALSANKFTSAVAASSEWRCDTCMCTSPASSQVCIVCQAKRPSTSSVSDTDTAPAVASSAAVSSSEWRCDTCMCTSPASSQVCVVCQAKRPAAAALTATPPDLPKKPSFIDSGPATAPIFSMFSQQQPQPSAKWQCDTCLVENVISVSRCVACESPKPGTMPAPKQDTFAKTDSVSGVNKSAPVVSSTNTGGFGTATITFGAPSTTSDCAPKITFGVPSTASASGSAPKITFGVPSTASASDSAPKITFGVPSTASASDSAPKITFGVPSTASASDSAPKISFGAPSTASASDSAPKISFGVPSTASASDSAPKITFGVTSTAPANGSATKLTFGVPSAASSSESISKTTAPLSARTSDSAPKLPFTNFPAVNKPNESAATVLSSSATVTANSSEAGLPNTIFGASSDSGAKFNFTVPSGVSTNSETNTNFSAPLVSASNPGFKVNFNAPLGTGVNAATSSATSSSSSEPKPNPFGLQASSGSLVPKSMFGIPSADGVSSAPTFNFGSGQSKPAVSITVPSSVTVGASHSSKRPFDSGTSGAQSAVPSTFVFGGVAPGDLGPAGNKLTRIGEAAASAPTFSFLGGNIASNTSATVSGANNGGNGTNPSMFSANGGASTGLFGSAKPNVDLDDNHNNNSNKPAIFSSLPGGAPPQLNFSQQLGQSTAPSSIPFVFGASHPQPQRPSFQSPFGQAGFPDQQQSAPQLMPSNGPVDGANPFNIQQAGNRGAVGSRPRIAGRRRLPK